MHRCSILREVLVQELHESYGVEVFQHRFSVSAGVGPQPVPPAPVPEPAVAGPNTDVPSAKRLAGLFGRRGGLRRRPRLNRHNRRQIGVQEFPACLQPYVALQTALAQRGSDLIENRGQPGFVKLGAEFVAAQDVLRKLHGRGIPLGLQGQDLGSRQHSQLKCLTTHVGRLRERQCFQRRHRVVEFGLSGLEQATPLEVRAAGLAAARVRIAGRGVA